MLLLALLACDPAPAPTAPAPTTVAPPAAAPSVEATAAADELAPLAAHPELYGQQILVILSSSLEPGAQPEGLAAAATVEGAAPARLSSTAFKGLMPCYEIVVAGGYSDKAQARAVSATLKARGVDHYLKAAGAFVGPRPELDDACASLRSPPAGDARVLFLDRIGARLPLEVDVAARALTGTRSLRPVDPDREAWSAALPVETVERWSVGDVLVGIEGDHDVVDCPVTGFVEGVVGIPHFGWYQDSDKDQPGCGAPAVYVQVDCQVDLLMPTGSTPVVGTAIDESATVPRPELPEPWEDELTALRALGNEGGEMLQETWTRQTYQLGERQVQLVRLRLQTGEGEAVCGGDDYLAEAAGLLDLQGRALTPLLDTTLAELLGVFAPDGSKPALHLRDIITASQSIIGDGLEIDQGRAYCDCPC